MLQDGFSVFDLLTSEISKKRCHSPAIETLACKCLEMRLCVCVYLRTKDKVESTLPFRYTSQMFI